MYRCLFQSMLFFSGNQNGAELHMRTLDIETLTESWYKGILTFI